MPTAFRNGFIDLPPVTPFGQGGNGLVWWTKGNFEVVESGGIMVTGGNKATPSFNPGVRAGGVSGAVGPQLGIDSLDGVPGETWTTDMDVFVSLNVEPTDGSGAVHLKDRAGNLFGFGAGETQTMTLLSVVTPRLSAANGGTQGGTLLRLGNTAGGGQLDCEFIFRTFVPDLPPVGAESLTIASNDWTTDFATAVYGPATPAATYQNKPLLLHQELHAGRTPKAWVSGPGIGTMVPIVLAPATLPAVSTHTHTQSTVGTTDIVGASHFDRWVGAMYERILQDFLLSLDAAALTYTYGYLAAQYPTLGIVVP